jgi:hypothetical protein|tara:strand:- start:61 stop:450 length:390 start_codon:yes stop_codon:yes gene_type:complete
MSANGLIPKTQLQKIYEKFMMLNQIITKAIATGEVQDVLTVFPAYDKEVGRWKIALVIASGDGALTPIATFVTQEDCTNRLDPDIDSNFDEVVLAEMKKDKRLLESIEAFDRELVMPIFNEGIEPFLSK